jgi:hypothetical protein
MAHGKSLTLREIKPTARFTPMKANPSFVCTRETARGQRRNIYFMRLPKGMGNNNAVVRAALKAAKSKVEENNV